MSASICARALAAGLLLAAVSGCERRAAASIPMKEHKPEARIVAMARGEVDVYGGMVHVVAPSSGRLALMGVFEGQRVAKGQILASLDLRVPALTLAAARASLAEARAQMQLMESRWRYTQGQNARVRMAHDEHAVSAQVLDEAREGAVAAEAELARSKGAVEAALVEVQSAELALRMRVISAPETGLIAAVTAAGRTPGLVDEGTELFLLRPAAPLIVRAWLDEEFAVRVRPGMRAEVQMDSTRPRWFAARVLHLAGILRPQNEGLRADERQDVRSLECTLSIAASDALPGQRVLVRFLDAADSPVSPEQGPAQ